MSIVNNLSDAFTKFAKTVTSGGKAETGGGGMSGGLGYGRAKKKKSDSKEDSPEYLELFQNKNSFGNDGINLGKGKKGTKRLKAKDDKLFQL